MVASNDIQTGTASGARTERFRRGERAFWDHHGLAPTERFVTVGSPPVRLRVQELGSGPPVLFVNGTGVRAPTSPRCSVSCTASAAWSWTGPAEG